MGYLTYVFIGAVLVLGDVFTLGMFLMWCIAPWLALILMVLATFVGALVMERLSRTPVRQPSASRREGRLERGGQDAE